MRNIAILLILVLLAVAAPCATPVEGENYSMLTLSEAYAMYGRPGAVFIDVNEPEIYEQAHIPGATWVTDEHLERFLPAGKNTTLVFYCYERRCSGSHAAAHEAVRLGYTKVFVMPAGILGWANAGLPTARGKEK
ncbi:MAG: rhodanese-like domain-containing protein [Acidobacteriota bacterium]|nr:rhodanese-like domain-containing protein [Acidobacteriota bacterium]